MPYATYGGLTLFLHLDTSHRPVFAVWRPLVLQGAARLSENGRRGVHPGGQRREPQGVRIPRSGIDPACFLVVACPPSAQIQNTSKHTPIIRTQTRTHTICICI